MLNVNDLIGKITCADCMDILKQLPDKCVDFKEKKKKILMFHIYQIIL